MVTKSEVYCCLTLLRSGLKGKGDVALHPDCIQVSQTSSDSMEMHMHGSKPKHYDRSTMPPRCVSRWEQVSRKLILTQVIYSLGCSQGDLSLEGLCPQLPLTLPLTCCCSGESSVSTNCTTLAMLQSLPEAPHRRRRCHERK